MFTNEEVDTSIRVGSRPFPKNSFGNQPKREVHKQVFRIGNLHTLINEVKIRMYMMAKCVCSKGALFVH